MYINFKSKYKKIFWLLLGFIIACFFITSNVKAVSSDYYDMSQWIDISEFTLPSGISPDTHYIVIVKYDTNSYILVGFPKNNNRNYFYYNTSNSTFPTATIKWQGKDGNGYYNFFLTYYLAENSKTFREYDNKITQLSSGTLVYTNKNILASNKSSLWFDLSKVNFTSTYTVNFHLDGGSVWDLSNLLNPHLITEDYSIQTTTDELEEYLTHLTPLKDYSNFIGWYYDSDFTHVYVPGDILSSNIDLYAKFELYDYLQGYKRIDLTTDDRYYMLSDVSSGSVFIPKRAFDDYGGRLSYYDNDLSSQPYTSYIQDYVTTPDDKFVRQDFDLSNYAGADWVMFSKYIYLEGEANISYSIFVPDSSYDSSVVITPNSSGGNKFDFEYKDSNGNIQEAQVNSTDLSQTSPLLGNIFDDFSTNTFGLTSIITAPLSLIQSLSSTSCTPLNLPLPFIDGTLILPCMYDFYSNTFGVLFTLYQTITFGVVAYWVLVRIFNMVKDFKNPDHDEIEVVDL